MSHMVQVQGAFILKKAEGLRALLEMEREKLVDRQGTFAPSTSNSEVVSDHADNTAVFEGLDQMFNEEGFFGMEPIWDFSLLFPSV